MNATLSQAFEADYGTEQCAFSILTRGAGESAFVVLSPKARRYRGARFCAPNSLEITHSEGALAIAPVPSNIERAIRRDGFVRMLLLDEDAPEQLIGGIKVFLTNSQASAGGATNVEA